jgi:SAM-dependent methyltransferase
MPTERELAQHWDQVGDTADRFRDKNPVLAHHKRDVYRDLVGMSRCAEGKGLILKTDLFAEAFNQEEFVSGYVWSNRLVGIDISPNVVLGAKRRLAIVGSPLRDFVVCDVGYLPFRQGAFGAVISDSTLDHLPSSSAIVSAIAELGRVLSGGGRMLLTIDNPHNLTFPPRFIIDLWMKLRLAPYYIGYTLNRNQMRAALAAAGLHMRYETAILHYPHPDALVRAAETLTRTLGFGRLNGLLLAVFRLQESLASTPLQYLTGRYLAVAATKEAGAVDTD